MARPTPKSTEEPQTIETREWSDSLDAVLQADGPARVSELLRDLSTHAAERGVTQPFTANTPYINTIHASRQPAFPGNREIERRIKSVVRWNAMAMVVRANHVPDENIGGPKCAGGRDAGRVSLRVCASSRSARGDGRARQQRRRPGR